MDTTAGTNRTSAAPLSHDLAAAYVAHEIANILTPVRIRAQLAMRHADDPSRVCKEVEQILLATQRALEAAETVVKATQAPAADLGTSESIRSVLTEIATEFSTDASSVSVTGHWPERSSSISPDEIRVVVGNLVRNAVDMLGDSGGEVVVRLIEPAECSTGNTSPLVLEVSDNGPGVSPKVGSGLFEPYRTSRQGRPGLGLSLCRDLMTRHGGTIALQPSSGAGTTFRLELPVVAGQEAGITTTSAGSTVS